MTNSENNGKSTDAIKKYAKNLKKKLQASGVDINHTTCLEVVAAGFGFDSWKACSVAGRSKDKEFFTDDALARLAHFESINVSSDQMRQALLEVIK